jgi:hypothetical protein
MDESSRVHQQPIDAFVRRAVDAPDRFALDVRIVDFELKTAFARVALQQLVELRGRRGAVDLGLALAEIGHVGTLDKQYFHWI